MAAGAGLGAFLPVVMALVGIVSILRARRARRDGATATDAETRRASAAEMERRMAFYLAARDSDRAQQGSADRNG